MCRISATKGEPYAYMRSGGIKTFYEEHDGIKFVHEWLPIQTDPKTVKTPFIHWEEEAKGNEWIIFEPEKYTVLFNGEIFGHDKADDMELIRSFGNPENLISYLSSDKADGFWSFIIYSSDGDVTAIVDPLSKKQLYYKEGFGISSELKCLIAPNEELDPLFFSSTIKFGYVTDDSTPYKRIKRVMPNSVVHFTNNFRVIAVDKNYRDLSPKLLSKEEFLRTMQTSIDNRLAGHLPVSLLLSGGLDSSIIRFHLYQNPRANITSYCINNEEDMYYAKLMDPNVKEVVLGNYTIEQALNAMEMPLDLGSMLPQYALMNSVESTVVLTGDGADEVFGGYRRTKIYDSVYSDVFEELPFYHHVRLDRMAGATTKEIRSPFLHLDIVRHGLALDYRDRINKKYLRDIYGELLPHGIVERPKEPLKSKEVRDSMNSPEFYRAELVDLWLEKYGQKNPEIFFSSDPKFRYFPQYFSSYNLLSPETGQ